MLAEFHVDLFPFWLQSMLYVYRLSFIPNKRRNRQSTRTGPCEGQRLCLWDITLAATELLRLNSRTLLGVLLACSVHSQALRQRPYLKQDTCLG